MDYNLLFACLSGITLLLILILWIRLNAFLSLLIASIWVGLWSGMSPDTVIDSIQKGMASTLGFVAMVVGLGAIFGAILQHSGGASALANHLLGKFGIRRAPMAMTVAGFIIAIPVFFDVAFIILIPIVYALQRRTGKSLLLYAMPLLAGLAITHAFIPPTPGPVAVADIIGVELGQVILYGLICAIPTAIVAALIFGNYIGNKIYIKAPETEIANPPEDFPPLGSILFIVFFPIVLIVLSSILSTKYILPDQNPGLTLEVINFVGHPFTALLIANLLAWYILGIRRGFSRKELVDVSSKSFAPAGLIILVTGAGGVFKQVLIDTGVGEMLAQYFAEIGLGSLLFAFLSAAVVRILQGSATVAMITSAGLTAPLLSTELDMTEKSLVVLAIAAGASILSHLNDSGFWLVAKYLGMDEKQTFQSWSVMTCIISLTGFAVVWMLSFFI